MDEEIKKQLNVANKLLHSCSYKPKVARQDQQQSQRENNDDSDSDENGVSHGAARCCDNAIESIVEGQFSSASSEEVFAWKLQTKWRIS